MCTFFPFYSFVQYEATLPFLPLPQGATIKRHELTGDITVARVIHGGLADKSGKVNLIQLKAKKKKHRGGAGTNFQYVL